MSPWQNGFHPQTTSKSAKQNGEKGNFEI